MTTLAAPRPAWPRWAAWAFCLLIFAIIVGDAVHRPLAHTTMPTYRAASAAWWEGHRPLHRQPARCFLYFPQAAFLFTPFNVLPFTAGEILWRAVTFGLFAYALVRLNGFFLAARSVSPARTFLFLALLAVRAPSPACATRSSTCRWPRWSSSPRRSSPPAAGIPRRCGSAWPCAEAAGGRAAAALRRDFRRLIPRLLIGLPVVVAVPFLHWNPAFVAHEYVRCYETLLWASKGDEPRYSDVAALLAHAGIVVPQDAKTVARVIFALGYLGLGLAAVRRPAHAGSRVGDRRAGHRLPDALQPAHGDLLLRFPRALRRQPGALPRRRAGAQVARARARLRRDRLRLRRLPEARRVQRPRHDRPLVQAAARAALSARARLVHFTDRFDGKQEADEDMKKTG
ncbi:MAG: glycosyltransferase family 87 protein [Verrucomicrobiota bacterium]